MSLFFLGPVNTILSWGVWAPLGRLTYCAYLVHPIVIFNFLLSRKELVPYSDYNMVGWSLAAWPTELFCSTLHTCQPFRILPNVSTFEPCNPHSSQNITESQILQISLDSHQMDVKSLIQALMSPAKR